MFRSFHLLSNFSIIHCSFITPPIVCYHHFYHYIHYHFSPLALSLPLPLNIIISSSPLPLSLDIIPPPQVFCEVEPKRLALEEATNQLADAEHKLAIPRAKLAVLQETLSKLTKEYERATKAKAKCQAVSCFSDFRFIFLLRIFNFAKVFIHFF